MNPCPSRDELLQYVRGALAEERAAAIDVHLDACSACNRVAMQCEQELRLANQLPPGTEDFDAAAVRARGGSTPSVLERPGSFLGPYKLLEQIGEGGFGVVFLAEQKQPVRRKVAVKVIKPGMVSREVIARFEAERQALALMDHPNIARVFDAGEAASGRPYFVMELVKGIPITKYCDEARLTMRERLALFVDVCQAIQHAHQKGIIHRDLKPSNILVTLHGDRPVVKVIDFGIAKATGEPLTDKTLFTAFSQFIGTPLYMSPEQAALSGLDIDTRSDVYSLGVVLYELLTGTTPLTRARLQEAEFDEVRRLIREQEAERPSLRISTIGDEASAISQSRRTEPAQLRKLLQRELDWIALKAIEKDRSRRYESASSLARDIERYLHDEPVAACPPSSAYLAAKFFRRHRAVTITIVSVVIALLVGIALTAWQAIRAQRAETTVVAERTLKDKALARIKQMLEVMSAQIETLGEDQKDFLEIAAKLNEELAVESATDPPSLIAAANTSMRLAQIYSKFNLPQDSVDAAKLSESHFRQLLKLQPAEVNHKKGLWLAIWHQASVHRDLQTDRGQVEPLELEVLRLGEEILLQDSEFKGRFGGALRYRAGMLLTSTKDPTAAQIQVAQKLLDRALTLQLEVVGPDTGNTGLEHVEQLAQTREVRVFCFEKAKAGEAAEKERQLLQPLYQLLGETPPPGN